MSDGQREIICRNYEAFGRRDLEAVRDDIHPDFELDFSKSLGPDRGIYRGADGIRKLWETYWEAFDSLSIEPEEFIDAGDEVVVVIVRARGRGRGSGVDVDARGPHVWRFREGKVIGFTLYQEVTEALEAVGLREPDPVSPIEELQEPDPVSPREPT
jgi:ketosteroid isomerase-like protein